MRTPALISLATLFALPLAASAQIYSWKDASGKVHYSDKPPIEKKVQTRELKSGKASGGETAAPASKERTGDGTAPGKGEGGANGTTAKNNADQALEEAEARQKLCDNARKRLIQLEATGGVLLTKNEKGEQVPLVGGARKAETEAARKDVEQWCK